MHRKLLISNYILLRTSYTQIVGDYNINTVTSATVKSYIKLCQ